MNIVTYFDACQADTTFPTANELIVSPTSLGFDVDGLVNDSENRVLEIAQTLYYEGGKIVAKHRTEGTATTVAFDCAERAKEADYIGDLHNHPYRKKMGARTYIGPSSGDYEQWIPNPCQKNLTLHFVTCGDFIFLVVTRRGKTSTKFDFKASDFDTEDFLNDKMRAKSDTLDVDPGQDPAGFRRWLEREMPKVPGEWVAKHKAMQIDLARRHGFEVFFGPRDRTSVLTLISAPAYPRSALTSQNYGAKCSECGAVHGKPHSSALNRWHACRSCGAIYCGTCGSNRLTAISLSREKICNKEDCGGTTRLIY